MSGQVLTVVQLQLEHNLGLTDLVPTSSLLFDWLPTG